MARGTELTPNSSIAQRLDALRAILRLTSCSSLRREALINPTNARVLAQAIDTPLNDEERILAIRIASTFVPFDNQMRELLEAGSPLFDSVIYCLG